MINLLKSHLFFLLFGVALLTGCNANEVSLTDGDKNVTEEIDEVISDYIIQKYASIYPDTEKQFEVHKVYGTSESDGILSVYMWSYYGGFNKSTRTEKQAGHSLPAVVQLKKGNDKYELVDYMEPKDGTDYQSSLKEMFPAKYLELVRDEGNDIIRILKVEMDENVKQWLEKEM